ncbi:hepatocyte cell adhesion molecule-like [Hypomesus transpacificus]|uniref:hepatocyte cell adhesion molecule-like n=1 Tax=Hypomesus transpacificus TaxID=137520 RepID=UPI001F074EAE|nr:hepatocyte cell adhesion molecule-like [Hypomesus transpacificus]
MDLILVVFLVVFRATQGSRICNLSDAVGTVKCSGTLGEPFFLHLTSDTTGKDIRLNKEKESLVFRFTNNVSKVLDPDYMNRIKFFTNGTFWLDSAVRTDRGLYQLEVFNPDGNLFQKVNMTLDIQVPVSEPVLSLICLSGGETQVTCSSEGEPVEYRWSLAGQSLTKIDSSNQSHHTTTITLQGHMTGSVTCEVQNDVSTNSNTIQLSACSEFPDITLTVTVTVSITVATLILLFSLFLGVRHLLKKTRFQNVHSGGGGEEVIYADVTVGRTREKATPSPVPQEVEYGQVAL